LSEIVNLRQVRKRAARAAQADAAAVNRAKHGQTKAEKASTRANAQKLRNLLDGVKREDPKA
jgi:ribosomal protein S2